jgi:hypothetical protein
MPEPMDLFVVRVGQVVEFYARFREDAIGYLRVDAGTTDLNPWICECKARAKMIGAIR